MTADRKRTVGRTLAMSVVFAAMAGGVAAAAGVPTTGAYASNVGRTLTIKDTLADGDNAYSNWNSSGANRVTTSGGNGSTATVTPSVLNNFRACRDQGSFNPDNCSSYVNP